MGTQENIKKLKELGQEYPKTLKIMLSEKDIDSIDIMSGDHRSFDNSDSYMMDFISQQLAAGKEVAIQAAGSDKLLILYADRGRLFKKNRW